MSVAQTQTPEQPAAGHLPDVLFVIGWIDRSIATLPMLTPQQIAGQLTQLRAQLATRCGVPSAAACLVERPDPDDCPGDPRRPQACVFHACRAENECFSRMKKDGY